MNTALRTPPTRARAPHPPGPNEIARKLIGRDYLSYSSISTYQRCPLQFCFRYVEGFAPEFKSPSLVFGGAIHTAIEQHYRAFFEGEQPPDLDTLMTTYEKAWAAEATGTIKYGKGESAESLHDLASGMLAAFQASEVSKLDTPATQLATQLLGVEEEFRAPLIPGCPDILGRVDLLTVNPTTLRITDFKTSRSAWGNAKVEESAPQQLLYSELVAPLAEACGRPIEIEWIVLTKGKQPAVHRHTLRPTLQAVARTKAIVRQVWQAIAARHFYPSPSAMNCATCPYATACREWEG